jgi:hypothetical protein
LGNIVPEVMVLPFRVSQLGEELAEKVIALEVLLNSVTVVETELG